MQRTSSPTRLVWPPLCANCAAPPAGRLKIARAFVRERRFHRRSVDDPFKWWVTTIDVPFCAACIARHQATVVEVSVLRRVVSAVLTPYVIPIAICATGIWLYFNPFVLGPPDNRIVVTPDARQFAVLVGMLLVCAGFVWYSTRRLRMAQDTEISRAFDFSEKRRYFWQSLQRTYRLRNDTFAAAFVAANPE